MCNIIVSGNSSIGFFSLKKLKRNCLLDTFLQHEKLVATCVCVMVFLFLYTNFATFTFCCRLVCLRVHPMFTLLHPTESFISFTSIDGSKQEIWPESGEQFYEGNLLPNGSVPYFQLYFGFMSKSIALSTKAKCKRTIKKVSIPKASKDEHKNFGFPFIFYSFLQFFFQLLPK